MIRPTVSVGLIIVAGLVGIPSRTRPTAGSLPVWAAVRACPGRHAQTPADPVGSGSATTLASSVSWCRTSCLGPPMAISVCHDIQHMAGSAPSLWSTGCLAELVMRAPGRRPSTRWTPWGWAGASSCWRSRECHHMADRSDGEHL